jgi:hypothetical protein
MSPRRNWDSPNSSLASECALPPDQKVEGHWPAAKGVRESQFRRLEKKLSTLPTLCWWYVMPASYRYVVHSTVRGKLLLTYLYAFKWNRKVTSGRNELKRNCVQHILYRGCVIKILITCFNCLLIQKVYLKKLQSIILKGQMGQIFYIPFQPMFLA